MDDHFSSSTENSKELYLCFLIISSLTVILILVFNSKWRSRRSRRKLPPGPRRLPVIGNLHHLVGNLPHRSLHQLAEKHGPLMHLQLGHIPAIIVSSPEVAYEIMKAQDLRFCSRPSSQVFDKFSYGGLDIALAKYGESWRQMRRLATSEIFSLKRVQSFRGVKEEEVEVLVQSIHRSSSKCTPVNLSDMFVCLTNNIICREVFGKRFSDDGECNRSENHQLVLEIIELIGGLYIVEFFPCLQYWLDMITGGLQKKLGRSFKRMDELFEREIEEHCLIPTDHQGHKEDFVDVLLKLQKNSVDLGFSLTREQIKAILMNMFLGGTGTSAATLEWAMSELMRHPKVMKKAQDEIRGIVGKKGKVEVSDLQQISYLKLIINETLRLHCIFPLLPRESMEECEVNGYIIPEKTRVYINAWTISRDPKLWEDPQNFIPERFEASDINFKGQHFKFIPFGGGRRICPGMQFGITTVEIALANILCHFDWEPPFGTSHKDIDMTEAFGFVLNKKSPLILMARSREGQV